MFSIITTAASSVTPPLITPTPSSAPSSSSVVTAIQHAVDFTTTTDETASVEEADDNSVRTSPPLSPSSATAALEDTDNPATGTDPSNYDADNKPRQKNNKHGTRFSKEILNYFFFNINYLSQARENWVVQRPDATVRVIRPDCIHTTGVFPDVHGSPTKPPFKVGRVLFALTLSNTTDITAICQFSYVL